ILIVDDMPIFLEYLRGFIDWEAYGFEICCEAKDGMEALALFKEYYPDIVLTDITMPYMNGLELAEKIMEEDKETSVILITGNNEFEYARRAVKIGVCDYIVKPFEKEELIISLLKMQDNINRALEQRSKRQEDQEIKREEQLRRLIFSNKNAYTDTYKETLSHVGIEFESSYFLVYTIKIELYDNTSEYEKRVNWERVIVSMLGEMLDIEGSYASFSDYENNIVAILNFSSEANMKKYRGHEFQDLILMIKDYLGLSISVGVSDYCYDIKTIKDAYYQTLQAISSNIREERDKIWDYKKLSLEDGSAFYSLEVVEEILRNLELCNQEGIFAVIEQELDRVEAFHNEDLFRMICMSLLSLLLSNLVKNGRNIEDIFGEKYSFYERLGFASTHYEKREFLLSCYETVIIYEEGQKESKSYEVAVLAKQYIEAHYKEPDMSIQDISKVLLVNQTYLRKMFKSEMNMTLSEYITKYRLEMAQRLIRETDYKLFQVAEEVGYSDVSYFSKCFKKYYGVTPKTIAK
ncbi:MAG: two-component system, response regulator YesN, partial [Clostridiales bacterium]|nr:two-component system, response regulator YesN [Clostridiales bacterium]